MALVAVSTLGKGLGPLLGSPLGSPNHAATESIVQEASLRCSPFGFATHSCQLSTALPNLVPSVAFSQNKLQISSRRHRRRGSDRHSVLCRGALQELLTASSSTVSSEVDILEELNERADTIAEDLHGANIFLIGMMGCGKTTVGRFLAESLGYGFSDSDTVIEQTAGTSVASIFAEQGEDIFRDLESQAIHQLAFMKGLIVATGGGAILKPSNWRSMKNGIVVWIDVPRNVLAERVVAAGVRSRPILSDGCENQDPVVQALKKLNSLYEQREHLYSAADLRISLHDLAEATGCVVNRLSPAQIALQVVCQLESLLARRSELLDLVKNEGEDAECIRNSRGQCILPYNFGCSGKLSIRLGDLVSQ